MSKPIAPLLANAAKHPGLTVIGDTPLVAETPEELLDADTTSIAAFFVRNNGLAPEAVADPDSWTLSIDGEVEESLRLTLADLKARFPHRTYRMVLECGGNGRAFFDPPAKGNPWTNGGAGCAVWTGVSLGNVLRAARPKPSALYTAHYGADPHVSGRTDEPPISRGMPLAKAMEEHTLLVWAMNGEPLPHLHGGPLRLVVPGWPGSLSHKWLNRIWIRDREHDGPGMTGTSYRVPSEPIPPGSDGAGVPFRILESMPVRSIVTAPADGARLPSGTRSVAVRGAAWAGDGTVARVEVSADGGASWQEAALSPPRNRYDWVRFAAELPVPGQGSCRLLARATDAEGNVQPLQATNWNPQGYACNVVHGVTVTIG
ncbi:MAG TPA: sulfite oxidase [Microvirga sp.]|jgi:DMSO/TMAO reductase YedYZ molybdopterin-dependent catalytic subunit